jgi:hypothetical protein
LRAPLRPVTIGTWFQVRLEDRLQHQLGGSLRYPIPHRRNPKRPFAAARLRNHHPSHWLWSMRFRAKVIPARARRLCPPRLSDGQLERLRDSGSKTFFEITIAGADGDRPARD